MDANALAERLGLLAVEDHVEVAEYVMSVIAANANSLELSLVQESLQPYIEDEESLQILSEDILRTFSATQTFNATTSTLKADIKLRWTQPQPIVATSEEVLDKINQRQGMGRLAGDEREAILRFARDQQEKRMMEEIQEELSKVSSEPTGEENISLRNRSAVKAKIEEAQSAKAASESKHKAISQAASKNAKKEREEKKEERRRKAQKGERRPGS